MIEVLLKRQNKSSSGCLFDHYDDDDDDDDDDYVDDDDDDDKLILWNGWPTKRFKLYFQPAELSEILTITNHRYAASRIENLGST